jgi:hypothetical protein
MKVFNFNNFEEIIKAIDFLRHQKYEIESYCNDGDIYFNVEFEESFKIIYKEKELIIESGYIYFYLYDPEIDVQFIKYPAIYVFTSNEHQIEVKIIDIESKKAEINFL